MNTVLGAIASGRNILVLLILAVIGYFLFLTPPIISDLEGVAMWQKVLGCFAVFGWNFLLAGGLTWGARMLNKGNIPDGFKYKFGVANFVMGTAALIGLLVLMT